MILSINRLRNSKTFKGLMVYTAFTFLFELINPTAAFALTGGPSQPEVQSFEPVGTNQMVDLFTGDFNYNIPLMDVEGYPINLAYHSGITMDQEASWVGLGWNVNPGVVTRGMRGLPDDFSGDDVTTVTNIKPNKTWGNSIGVGLELFGFPLGSVGSVGAGLDLSMGIFYNNYKGLGYETGSSFSLSASDKSKAMGGDLSLGLNFNSQQGIDIRANMSVKSGLKNVGLGASVNSRGGLRSLNLNTTVGGSVINRSASIPILKPSTTYTPSFDQSYTSTHFAYDVKLGGITIPPTTSITFSGYYSEQALTNNTETRESYGYFYAQNSLNGPNALHDVNREKDRKYTSSLNYLPVTNFTYDVFNVVGQGVSGQYRTHRGEVATVYDSWVSSFSDNQAVGVEGTPGSGASEYVKLGGNYSVTNTVSTSGKWEVPSVTGPSRFQLLGESYEPAYFKKAGEMGAIDENQWSSYGGEQPIAVAFTQVNPHVDATTSGLFKVQNSNGQTTMLGVPADNKRIKRDKRNEPMSWLTAQEATLFGLETKIESYQSDYWTGGALDTDIDTYDRNTSHRLNHHISQVNVLQSDGSRYIYGIPAYNTVQKDITFNASQSTTTGPLNPTPSTGIVSYGSGQDANDWNSFTNKGIDDYYQKTETPAYVHSWMLSGVLSPDYVDRTGDGITDDDFGTAVKFNYTRVESNYKWRVPFQADRATYDEGFKSLDLDDKGHIAYGEKELWYTHSIESKNYVAEFIISDREDGFGVDDVNGGSASWSTTPMQRLDKIVLYSKRDRIENGVDAVPIKTVHFEYTYVLCDGIENNENSNGKLTLTKVYFTYGNSNKGKLNAYTFEYRDTGASENPNYNLRGYDRWGSYQKNDNTDGTYNTEFPYTLQNDQSQADINASAWHMDKINLPSGGYIDVTYESDDYAYVQNQRAMEMFKVLGFGDSPNATPATLLYDKSGANFPNYNYLYLDLHGTTTTQDFIDDYLGNDTEIFFRMLIDLTGNGDKEYVSGYAQIDRSDCGVRTATDEGYIKLKDAHLKDDNSGPAINPIAKAAWNFTRVNVPQLIYPGSDPNGTGTSALNGLLGAWVDMTSLITGHNRTMRRREYGQSITANQSWIRLYNPEGKKYGGGVRVKKITTNDNWDQMGGTTDEDFEYGHEFFYTLEDGVTSSGVAAYEPQVGNEENPLRRPKAFTEDRKLAPDLRYYVETPFGESFYPGASVGYSRVQVRNLQHTNVTRSATGKKIHKFYTAFDFPVIALNTDLDPFPAKPTWINAILKVDVMDHMTTSQGYTIINNNMHGKPRSVEMIDENGAQVSSVEYKYKTKANNPNRLDNSVTTINRDGTKSTTQIGVDMDLVLDSRETTQLANTTSWMVDGDILNIAGIPIPIPMLWVPPTTEDVAYRSMVATKVVTQFGILEEVKGNDWGATTVTKNLAWDSETGEVIVAEIRNEYDDPIYTFGYPAHWAYDGMGQAYKNQRVELVVKPTGGSVTAGKLFITDPSEFFAEGDEVLLRERDSNYDFVNTFDNSEHLWVVEIYDENVAANDYIVLMNREGALYTTSDPYVDLRILRSGRRNKHSKSLGTVTMLTNPLDSYFDPTTNNSLQDVISATAVEYSQNWSTYCEVDKGSTCDLDDEAFLNPFVWGLKGNWRSHRNYEFDGTRDQTDNSGDTKMREDGTFTSFTDFWNHPSQLPFWASDHNNWTWLSEQTMIDPSGNLLESRNALGTYSSSVFGYNNSAAVMVAFNAKHSELIVDNFEDYEFWPDPATEECVLVDHWSFNGAYNGTRVTTESHTGLSSMKVNANLTASKTKIYSDCSVSTSTYDGYNPEDANCISCPKVVNLLNAGIANGLTGQALYDQLANHLSNHYGIDMPASQLAILAQNCIDLNTGGTTTEEICEEDCPCIGAGLEPGRYLVSAWVKEENVNGSYDNTSVEVTVQGPNATTVMLQPSGMIIEGWQRVFGYVNVGQNTASITFSLNAGTNTTYFDDFRFQPADASANTYAFHPITLRLMGTLDDNNYATFYEYDEEGNVIRLKRETERGVFTYQETHGGLIK